MRCVRMLSCFAYVHLNERSPDLCKMPRFFRQPHAAHDPERRCNWARGRIQGGPRGHGPLNALRVCFGPPKLCKEFSVLGWKTSQFWHLFGLKMKNFAPAAQEHHYFFHINWDWRFRAVLTSSTRFMYEILTSSTACSWCSFTENGSKVYLWFENAKYRASGATYISSSCRYIQIIVR